MSPKKTGTDIKNKRNPVSRKTSSARKRKSSKRKSSRKKTTHDNNNLILVSGAAALVLVVLFASGVIIHSYSEHKTSPEEKTAFEKSISVKEQADSGKTGKGGQTPVNTNEKKESEIRKSAEKTKKEVIPEKKQEISKTEVKHNPPVQNTKDESRKEEFSVKKDEKEPKGTDPSGFSIPPAINSPKLVFVFDDAGYNTQKLQKYTNLKFPLTIAVMPKLPHSAECAEIARKAGKEVILHQPMQASNLKLNPGPGAITPDMNTFEIAEIIKENLMEIGPVKGVNNHEGSMITEDVIRMGTVLDVAAENNLYFLDSRTTAATKAPQAALERDMEILERDVFLDDVVTKEDILKEINRALTVANKKGKAIIIGHVDKSVDIIPAILEEMYPQLVAKGYRLCLPSDLL